jgi:hypothetical protein
MAKKTSIPANEQIPMCICLFLLPVLFFFPFLADSGRLLCLFPFCCDFLAISMAKLMYLHHYFVFSQDFYSLSSEVIDYEII